jgi:hypothetical protein
MGENIGVIEPGGTVLSMSIDAGEAEGEPMLSTGKSAGGGT